MVLEHHIRIPDLCAARGRRRADRGRTCAAAARGRPGAWRLAVERPHLHLVDDARSEAGDLAARAADALRAVGPDAAGAYPVLQVVAAEGRPAVTAGRGPAHVQARVRARGWSHRGGRGRFRLLLHVGEVDNHVVSVPPRPSDTVTVTS